MNHNEKYTELIAKYLAGQMEPGEKETLFAWVEAEAANKKFFEDMVHIWGLTAEAGTVPFEADMTQAWARIEKGIGDSLPRELGEGLGIGTEQVPLEKTSAKVVPLSKIIRRWSVAASILLALGALWWMNRQPELPQMVVVQTLEHEKKEVVLPDSSRIWLNENTKIVYEQPFAERKVSLEGEAFFEVQRMEESPFEITGGDTKTTVLGTSFNVRAYPSEGQVEVTVKTGKVAFGVTKQAAQPVLLAAGTSGVFDKKEEKVTLVEQTITNADSWKTGMLDFNHALMKDVIQTLERYFDVKIEVSSELILACHYKATFNKPELPEILAVLAPTFNLKVTQNGSTWLLSGEGCKPDN